MQKNKKPHGCQVLIIDDEPDIVKLLAAEMKDRNLSCLSALDGKTALELIDQKNPAVIVSDYKMPGFNGIELLLFLRNIGNSNPVIWVTGYAEVETVKQAWGLGVFHLFTKPIDPQIVGFEVLKALSMTAEDWLDFQPTFLTDLLRERFFQKLQVELDKPLYEKTKQHCIDRSLSINSFMVELLRKALV